MNRLLCIQKLQKVYKWFCLFIVNGREKFLNFLGPIKKDVYYKQENLGESDRCSIWIFQTDYLLTVTYILYKKKKNQDTTVLRVNGGIHLLVLFLLFLFYSAPVVITETVPGSDFSVHENDTFSILCNVEGSPSPSASWNKTGGESIHETIFIWDTINKR